MAAEEESLESLLNKATSPLNRDEDWDFIMAFCDQINKELEGPQIAVRLLAHKIQSPQEKESLYALVVLEACVKNCGRRFHQEIGKFRFLNELIKVVSPKYLGSHMTEKVKTKVIELMYSWSKGLQHEGKIVEAYQMLKRQGIVKEDPTYVDQTVEPPPLAQPRSAVFEDEEKSKLLARLLKSKHPEDLQAANRLIKNMVKQDCDRMEKVSKRVQELETVNNNMKVLDEMMQHSQQGAASQAERDVMKELYENLEKSRPNLFRLASSTDDKDTDGINEILSVNDKVLQVMNEYKKMVEQGGDELLLKGTDDAAAGQGNLSSLLDLDLNMSGGATLGGPSQGPVPPPYSAVNEAQTDSLLLDGGLATLGGSSAASGDTASNQLDQLGDIFSSVPTAATTASQQVPSVQSLLDSLQPQAPTPPVANSGLTALGALSQQPGVPAQTFPATSSTTSLLAGLSQPMPSQATFGSPQLTMGVGSAGILAPAQMQTQPAMVQGPLQSTPQPVTASFGGIPPVFGTPRPVVAGAGAGLGTGTVPAGLAKPLVPQTQQMIPSQPQQPGVVSVFSQPLTNNTAGNKTAPAPTLSEIDKLGESLMKESLAGATTPQANTMKNQKPTAAVAGQITVDSPVPTPPVSATASPQRQLSAPGTPSKGPVEVASLTDIFIALETIQPGSLSPVTAYEKNGLKLIMHFGKERPRPDVQVMVVSVMSTNSSPIKNFSFQAAVPKVMKVKLQPPSATDLPAHNPILPPTAITQVMLVANPLKENIRLKFKVSYRIDDNNVSDVGEVDNFPVQ